MYSKNVRMYSKNVRMYSKNVRMYSKNVRMYTYSKNVRIQDLPVLVGIREFACLKPVVERIPICRTEFLSPLNKLVFPVVATYLQDIVHSVPVFAEPVHLLGGGGLQDVLQFSSRVVE